MTFRIETLVLPLLPTPARFPQPLSNLNRVRKGFPALEQDVEEFLKQQQQSTVQ